MRMVGKGEVERLQEREKGLEMVKKMGLQGPVRGRPAPQAERGKYGAGEETSRDEAAGRSAWPPLPSGCTKKSEL